MKKLSRSNDRVLAGVLGGIAEYFNVDATLVRLAYVFFGIFANVGAIILYILAILLMPTKKEM